MRIASLASLASATVPLFAVGGPTRVLQQLSVGVLMKKLTSVRAHAGFNQQGKETR